MRVTEEEREAIWKRNLRRKRKAAAERKKIQKAEERATKRKYVKTPAQKREEARKRRRQRLLEQGGMERADGVVIPTKINAQGKRTLVGGTPDGRNNKVIVEKLLAALRAGHTNTDAATFAGIAQCTFYKWLNQGAQAEEGTLAREFLHKVELARAESVAECLQSIKKAAKKGTWQAAAWFLEKRVPEVYGKRSEVTVSQNKPFEIALADAGFSEDEMQAALKAVLAKNPELIPITVEAETVEE